jgi:hypothetical protein
MKYQVVTAGPDGALGSKLVGSPAEIEAMGYSSAGVQAQRKPGLTPIREALVGAPIYAGLYGPMWGGEIHGSKEPIVRYESAEAYELLSM